MMPKILFSISEDLPCPCILLATEEMLANWYTRQLEAAWERGERRLSVHCFTTLGTGTPEEQAHVIVTAIRGFLAVHEDVEQLELCCVRSAGAALFAGVWAAQDTD